MTTELYRERQLWSGNEKVKIRYVSDNFVAGTSTLSPGVSRHIQTGPYLVKSKTNGEVVVDQSNRIYTAQLYKRN